jgi:hypothetical protein
VIGRLSSLERVAHFIVEVDQRLRSRGTDNPPVELHPRARRSGIYLGLTLETITRSFRKLKDMHVSRWLALRSWPSWMGSDCRKLPRGARRAARCQSPKVNDMAADDNDWKLRWLYLWAGRWQPNCANG